MWNRFRITHINSGLMHTPHQTLRYSYLILHMENAVVQTGSVVYVCAVVNISLFLGVNFKC